VGAIHPAAREVLESDALAHLVTINRDGSPQVSVVWAGLDGDELVTAHLRPQQKLRNVERDPRVVLSFEAEGMSGPLHNYLVVHGRARIVDGGAADWLQHLAHTYLGPDVRFPRVHDPPPGWRLRIEIERLGGVGPWTA
jgi:PPOX class probable F420-dependent enzyme